jgi:hypothetical protein
MPKTLIMQLKRFNPNLTKNNRHIRFPVDLDLAEFSTAEGRTACTTYTLCGVCVHEGSSLNSGHYIAYFKAPDGTWNCADDETVRPVGQERVLSCTAYMLFYVRTQDAKPRRGKEPAAAAKMDKAAAARSPEAWPAAPPAGLQMMGVELIGSVVGNFCDNDSLGAINGEADAPTGAEIAAHSTAEEGQLVDVYAETQAAQQRRGCDRPPLVPPQPRAFNGVACLGTACEERFSTWEAALTHMQEGPCVIEAARATIGMGEYESREKWRSWAKRGGLLPSDGKFSIAVEFCDDDSSGGSGSDDDRVTMLRSMAQQVLRDQSVEDVTSSLAVDLAGDGNAAASQATHAEERINWHRGGTGYAGNRKKRRAAQRMFDFFLMFDKEEEHVMSLVDLEREMYLVTEGCAAFGDVLEAHAGGFAGFVKSALQLGDGRLSLARVGASVAWIVHEEPLSDYTRSGNSA